MSQLHELFQMYSVFSVDTFEKATEKTSLLKLRDELEELEIALDNNTKEHIVDEYVDCVMCLVHSFSKLDITIEEFRQAFQTKLLINIAREWNYNTNGTYSHKK